MQMRNITSKPRSCEIRALLACRDLREAPEHPLELVRLPKQEQSARKRRKKVLTLEKKRAVLCFCALNRTLANAVIAKRLQRETAQEGTHARKS